MGLEAATYIADFVTTNPVFNDQVSQGDDHIRMIKQVLQNTFPNQTGPFTVATPGIVSKSADYVIVAGDVLTNFLVDTTGGAVTLTLPILDPGAAGWSANVMKINTGPNPIFIAPATGTLTSGALTGLAKTRRAIAGVRCTILWTGSTWWIERATKEPIGSVIDFSLASIPCGFELPNGQTLAGTAGSLYPDYYAASGGLVAVDITGRVVAMKEATSTRLTTGTSGIDGATLGAAGGADAIALSTAQLPVHSHTGTTGANNRDHIHQVDTGWGMNQNYTELPLGSGQNAYQMGTNSNVVNSSGENQNHTHSFTTDAVGSGNSHINAQPTIVLNKLLVVE